MTYGKSRIFAASLAACALGGAFWALSPALPWMMPQALARSPYDGTWSVLIVTDSGTCDRAYRYALRIADGRVFYDDPSFSVSGHVDARGNVSVGVSAGGQSAHGSGRLSGDYGDGRWTGSSQTSACSGHWEAERRG
ncbi:MAG TPA: hypothetical protein VMA30_22670 [Xanthobacteraceae bacterium]|nr:hypothetical protein [Xanthobacteraceae bacterium]